MRDAIRKFMRDERGLSAVEYGVAGALVVVGLVAAFQALGTEIQAAIDNIINALKGNP